MKRFHVHVAVHDLKQSIRFYSALFAAEPTVLRDDYAKWQLDDPRVQQFIHGRAEGPLTDPRELPGTREPREERQL